MIEMLAFPVFQGKNPVFLALIEFLIKILPYMP